MRIRTTNDREGFTLLELLVTVAIISILAMLSLSFWSNARQSNEQTVCLNRLRQLGIAQIAYSSDHDGWIAPNRFTDEMGYTAYWPQLLLPYLGMAPVTWPSSPETNLFTCPSVKKPTSYWLVKPLCYSQNISLGGSNYDFDGYPAMNKRAKVIKPSKMVILADGQDVNMASWSIDEVGNSDGGAFRHNKRINLLLLDGHVEASGSPVSPESGNHAYNWNIGSENN